MDQVTLVEEQIRDGEKFIEQLVRKGFPVTAACWAKTSEDAYWYLSLASPGMAKRGTRPAYRRVYSVIDEMRKEPFAVEPFDVKLIDPTDPIAKAVLQVQRRNPARLPAL